MLFGLIGYQCIFSPLRFLTVIQFAFIFLLVLLIVCVYHTVTIKSHQLPSSIRNQLHGDQEWRDTMNRLQSNQDEIIERFACGLRYRTISYDSEDLKNGKQRCNDQFDGLWDHIQTCYPLIHQHLHYEKINEMSRVYIWKGTNHSVLPYLICGHIDVVPIEDSKKWKHDPFGGNVIDGVIWGRGAIDMKQSIFGLLEAIEDLLTHNYQPSRTIYLAFGHDEEIGGLDGAKKIAEWFSNQSIPIQFEFCLDEGMMILDDLVPGHSAPIAALAVAEKGMMNVEVGVHLKDNETGHASAPHPTSAIGILSKALTRLESTRLPTYFHSNSPGRLMFTYIAPEMSGIFKFLFVNLWLFEPLIKRMLLSNPNTATLLRTTTALTIIRGGHKSNVLPSASTATINHRIHPSENVKQVLSRDISIVNDKRVDIKLLMSLEPSPVSSTQSIGYRAIESSIVTIHPNATVAPALLIANTDTKHYQPFSKQIYRFCPTHLNIKEVEHNTNIGRYNSLLHFHVFKNCVYIFSHFDGNLFSTFLARRICAHFCSTFLFTCIRCVCSFDGCLPPFVCFFVAVFELIDLFRLECSMVSMSVSVCQIILRQLYFIII